jgi:MFS-type transporter involved in bile tolerance (Atg22 family)
MFALLAACGTAGCSVGPWLAGLAMEHATGTGFFGRVNSALFSGASELKTGILTGTIFPVILLGLILFLCVKKPETAGE